MTVADKILSHFHSKGIRHIFLMPGAQIDNLAKAIVDFKFITPIIANNELSAGYMAEGYATINSNSGVVCSIGGPGAMCFIGSAVNAKLENTSVIYITGSVPTASYGTQCFQDTSIQGSNDHAVFKEAIGSSVVCKSIKDIDKCIDQIDYSIKHHCPVHIVLPLDIQRKKLDEGTTILTDQQIEDTNNSLIQKIEVDDIDNNTYEVLPLKTVMKNIHKIFPQNTICCLDSGQVRYAGNKYLNQGDKIKILQSSKQAPMGWALSASIGVKLATSNDTPVIAVFGDGSMRMHGIELATAVKYKLPIIFVLCDNQSYGTVYNRNKTAQYKELSSLNYIDWQEYAHAMGVYTLHVSSESMLESCFQRAMKLQKTCLIWIHTPKVDDILNDNIPVDWL
jgi:thiamine pyrophosphate-dependent acetolactate synthase large subunit-like protein